MTKSAVVIAFLATCLLGYVKAETYPKVKLELYYEALCPGCQEFITGPLTNTLALPDIVAITDIKLVPYGNTKKLEDGSFSCQHGVDECTSDVFELCTEYKLSGNISSITTGDTSYAAFPFIQCMEINEGNPAKAESCFSSTMSKSGLAWSTVTACADNEASTVQNQAALASPSHDYVPWVLLDGNLVEHTDALLINICKAYTGPAPPSCKRLYQKDTSVCMNK